MKVNWTALFLASACGWNAAIAAPSMPATTAVTVLTPTVIASQQGTATASIPPLGGTMGPGGVGGQFSYLPPGGQLMPGSATGGQLAPGSIPGGMLPLPPVAPFNFHAVVTNVYGAPSAPTSSVIVTGNTAMTPPGGRLSGNGVGGSAVIATGSTTRTVPGGFLTGNGIGGTSTVIVTGRSPGNSVAASPSSSVIVTGNALTGAGVGGTNSPATIR